MPGKLEGKKGHRHGRLFGHRRFHRAQVQRGGRFHMGGGRL